MYNTTITPRAKLRITETTDYLFTSWNSTVQSNFASELMRCLRIIKDNPLSFAIDHKEPRLRRCVVTPLNILYYAINDKEIIVISLEDTRMNPENRKLI